MHTRTQSNTNTFNPRQWTTDNQITLLTHLQIENLYTHGRGDRVITVILKMVNIIKSHKVPILEIKSCPYWSHY